MKVLLIGQKIDLNPRMKVPSYALYALRAHWKGQTKVLDFDADVPVEKMLATIQKEKADIVGFSLYIWNFQKLLECAKQVKRPVIFGGPHAETNYAIDDLPSPYPMELRDDCMLVIESSNGCPFRCGYCAITKKKKFVPLSRVFKDIKFAYNHPKVKEVSFTDPDFLANIDRAKAILRIIFKQKYLIPTNFEIYYAHITEEMADLLPNLPKHRFIMGLQSLTPAAQKAMERNLSAESFTEKMQQLKKWNPKAKTQVDIILGLPKDTYEGFLNTLDFVVKLKPTYIVLNYPLYLLPHSKFYMERDRLGFKYSSSLAVIETPEFPKRKMEEALKVAIWTQVFTYYFPELAELFYRNPSTDRLLEWIKVINIDIGKLVDKATLSVAKWNETKRNVLKNICERQDYIAEKIGKLENKKLNNLKSIFC